MNTFQKIAVKIAERGKYQGWKAGTKTADNKNLDAWCGAVAALEVLNHEDLNHVASCVAYIVAPRGYRETLKIVADAQANDETTGLSAERLLVFDIYDSHTGSLCSDCPQIKAETADKAIEAHNTKVWGNDSQPDFDRYSAALHDNKENRKLMERPKQ